MDNPYGLGGSLALALNAIGPCLPRITKPRILLVNKQNNKSSRIPSASHISKKYSRNSSYSTRPSEANFTPPVSNCWILCLFVALAMFDLFLSSKSSSASASLSFCNLRSAIASTPNGSFNMITSTLN